MKKKSTFFFAIILLISGAFISFLFFSHSRKDDFREFKIKGREIRVEIAAGSEGRQRGLGGREGLCENCGMLFIFPEKEKASFWMKDMNFDLDIIWITDSRISHIFKNADHSSLEKMSPEVPSDMVLELSAGFCDRYGIEVGDEATLE